MTTHVLMVLDASGSMSSKAEAVRQGHNRMLNDLREDGVDYRVTVTVFNYDIETLCEAIPLGRAPYLDEENYQTFGMTALLAAVGKTIEAFEQKVPVVLDGDRVMLVIQTDGQENYSFHLDDGRHTWERVSEMLVAREKRGWSIQYIGADADAWKQAHRLGVPGGSTYRVANTATGTTSTYDGVTRGIRKFSQGASPVEVSGIIAAHLTSDDK